MMNDQTWTNACLVCGIDIINERCGCSDFEALKHEERRGSTDQEWYVDYSEATSSNAESVAFLRPFVHDGYLSLDGKRVPVLRPAVDSRITLATYSGQSKEYRLWDSTDLGNDNEGSQASDSTGTEVH